MVLTTGLAASTAAVGPAQGARLSRSPSASALAAAVRVIEPGGRGDSSPEPPANGGRTSLPSFSYPGDGSVVLSGAVQATSSRSIATAATATAGATVANLSIFDGEITADSVSARDAATSAAGARGGGGATVVHLQALGRPIGRGTVTLGSWGSLTVGAGSVERSAPRGVKAYEGSVIGVLVKLTEAHDGLPAGSLIEVAVAQVAAATAPPRRPPPPPVRPSLVPGDRPQLLPAPSGPLVGVPQVVEPPLGTGSYVFPVYGRVSYSDDYGTLGPGVNYRHGIDIFGQLGQPLVAVASGTLFAVGWTRSAGNRLWLRDRDGNEFYYSHLSAFAAAAVQGAQVSAGEVIGFMGDTGLTGGGPSHLEFEIHPVSLLYLGSQGAVDPAPYLAGWRRAASVSLGPDTGWAPNVHATATAPEPGAILVSSSDIASVSAGGSVGLRRALSARGDG